MCSQKHIYGHSDTTKFVLRVSNRVGGCLKLTSYILKCEMKNMSDRRTHLTK